MQAIWLAIQALRVQRLVLLSTPVKIPSGVFACRMARVREQV
jgi:hypothetical protein